MPRPRIQNRRVSRVKPDRFRVLWRWKNMPKSFERKIVQAKNESDARRVTLNKITAPAWVTNKPAMKKRVKITSVKKLNVLERW